MLNMSVKFTNIAQKINIDIILYIHIYMHACTIKLFCLCVTLLSSEQLLALFLRLLCSQ